MRVISTIRASIGKIPDDIIQNILNIEKPLLDTISELITLNPDKSDEDMKYVNEYRRKEYIKVMKRALTCERIYYSIRWTK